MTRSHFTSCGACAWRRLVGGVCLLAALLLAGCAAMSVEECRTADWREQGERDALAGYPRARLAEVREACAEAGVVPQEALYWDGWNRGIVQFCTPDNGALWGRRGNAYRNSCPPALEPAFLSRYGAGRRAYDAERRLDSLRSDQQRKQRELANAKDDAARKRLRSELSDLDWRLGQARDELDRADRNFRWGY